MINPNPKPNLITQDNSKSNTKNETKDDKKDITIPNTLTITINTSVPGYQTIKYTPDMTIKNTSERTVWFDPLVPLEKSVIDKVPENIRVLEFFNKGLFESLINAHGNKKQMTLEQAKRNKIIDNNIQVTLNVLFPTNGILYIKGEPYAIADLQWTRSDWKIDRKIKDIPQVDVNKISDPITYNAIIKNEVQEANRQLQQLPKDLIYGANFNKETEELSSIDREKELIDNAKAQEAAKLKAAADAKAKKLEEDRLRALEEARLREAEAAKTKKKPPLQIGDATPPVTKPPLQIGDVNPPVPKPPLQIGDATPPVPKPPLQIGDATPPVPKPPLQIGDVKKPVSTQISPPLVEDIQNIQMSDDYKPNLPLSSESTKKLRTYFGSDDFYSMISMIFKYMTEEQKIFIQDIFKNTTNIDVKSISTNISKAAYNFTITGTKTISTGGVLVKKTFTDGLRVISNAGGGDCLFLAVADAINYYNYYSDIGNKIIYNIYGNGNNLFTTKVLRTIVSTEIIKQFNSNETFRIRSIEEGRINLDNLNDLFEAAITSQESSSMPNPAEYYNDTLLDIYKNHENFFVIIPNDSQVQQRNRPFKLVESNDEIKNYIESPYYWADQKTIDVLNKILKLNIITIENKGENFTIPYPTIKSNDNNNTWNKYLFLYNTEKHYELITFDYLVKKSGKNVRLKKTIFNRGDNIIPPFYIIFLIFAIFFVKLMPIDKENVILFSNYLYAIQNSFNIIINTPISSDKNVGAFINNYQNYFGPIHRDILGGAITNTTGSTKFLKKEEKQDNVQISFHITIDMELQKGTTLSKEQISNIKCTKGWNKVRKSFAEFMGRKYVIPPVYENLSDKYNKKEETNKKEADKKDKDNKNNNTQKNTSGGKRRRKTMKYLK
jgi:hypothetical protein